MRRLNLFLAKARMSEGKQINHKALIDEMAGHLDHFNADTFQAKDLERLINQVIIPYSLLMSHDDD